MDWLKDYQLILLDFDGLLVNTEETHYRAYLRLCERRGYVLPWSFNDFTKIAHYRPEGVRHEIYRLFPKLLEQEPHWDVLYREKKAAFLELIHEGAVGMMPGAHKFLENLANANVKRCIVTHSALPLVEAISHQQPILKTIPFWITREDYKNAKPDPECYKKAIKRYGCTGDQILGFEDSPRGLTALMGTEAKPVLVCQIDYPEIAGFKKQGVTRLRSFEELSSELL